MDTLTIDFEGVNLSDDDFYQLCINNRNFRFERNHKGDLIIMPPTGGATGKRNSDLIIELGIWNRKYKLGVVFDSSTGFKLPNKSDRSPDASWIPLEKWHNLTPEQQEKFLPLCPDFVIELRSKTDNLTTLQDKMQEYIDNGTRLGWLINRKDKQVEIYRQGKDKEILAHPVSLSGEDVLQNFILNLDILW
jgi:Uma2 family endonuclease